MRKWRLVVLLLIVMVLSACTTNDELSGKSFDMGAAPPLEEELTNQNSYQLLTTLEFLDGVVTASILPGEEGTYERTGDVLTVKFENGHEYLSIIFDEFQESDKEFSAYSAYISDYESGALHDDTIKKFNLLTNKIDKNMSLEFLLH
ncbi:hypothetical protein [Alkalihalobacillus pseudalcaliphilus]|uniref:hypothetical protein n=1 Tax=Alkalihalobacillus pseudalcaliphilus TaxID=79884 RepID=UPI00064E1105|nr:hypothetical protein [Alkalihalobacillus pseudalcaliphilus]